MSDVSSIQLISILILTHNAILKSREFYVANLLRYVAQSNAKLQSKYLTQDNISQLIPIFYSGDIFFYSFVQIYLFIYLSIFLLWKRVGFFSWADEIMEDIKNNGNYND